MTARALRMRVAAVGGVFFMLLLAVLGRVVQLCVVNGPELRRLAGRQQQQRVALPPERGSIVDRNGDMLAVSVESAAVYVRPAKFEAGGPAIGQLAHALNVPSAQVMERVLAPQRFVWLARGATPEQAGAITDLKLPGVGIEPSRQRFYPHGTLAGHVVGFSGIDSQGLEGVELGYDRILRGAAEALRVERDARGRRMLTEGDWQPAPRQGGRVELTIDSALQRVAEAELAAGVAAAQAAAGVAVMMDPTTGEILALASVPTFDPNHAAAATAAQWRNRAIADTYEPGSTFKAIVAAAALEEGVVHAADRIYCENGSYAVGKRVVHDHESYGWLTFADVIRHSSNIGAAKVGERLGSERFGTFLDSFGFGRPTGVDLPGEVAGLVRPSAKWGRIHLVTTSFGQGISVTPLQLVRAYAAIANGGRLLRPYIVRRVIGPDGAVVQRNEPTVEGQPISPASARVVRELLRGVVDSGTGTKAAIEGIPVAGKTGTAQKVDAKTGRYSARDRMSSFIGFAPVDSPRFVMLVVIDSPRTATYGGLVAAPVFRRIAEYAVDRLGLRVAPATVPEIDRAPAVPQLVTWTVPAAERGMPSFLGLSLRDALVQAERAGWGVETRGSGFVTAQDPPPGAETSPGARLVLSLGTDPGVTERRARDRARGG
jgi:cell division protein FtsI (penicillin-binding protein 3)